LKGCNLRCAWCHNPESQHQSTEVEFFPDKCIACGACVEACEKGAQLLEGTNRLYLRDLCTRCLDCVGECFSGALVATGSQWSQEKVMGEIDKDALYYTNSHGGVTFSGGEPLLQPAFLSALLVQCQQKGYHVAVDTAGNVPWSHFETVLDQTDLFLYDIKAFDSDNHRRATGVGNRLILENLRRLNDAGKDIWVRIPLVAGVNDSDEEIGGIVALLAPLKQVHRVDILPYHTLGAEKYASLDMAYPAQGYQPPSKERINAIVRQFIQSRIPASVME
jgi:pyruvate formate lyase activating enzyme